MAKRITALLLACLTVICFVGCKEEYQQPIFKEMYYIEDTELGEGAKTVTVDVIVNKTTVTFTIHTDAKTLGEALLEHRLIEGDQGEYGLYIKRVNGVLADYDVDKHYWGFYKNGEMMMTGVDGTDIADGEHYELKRQQ